MKLGIVSLLLMLQSSPVFLEQDNLNSENKYQEILTEYQESITPVLGGPCKFNGKTRASCTSKASVPVGAVCGCRHVDQVQNLPDGGTITTPVKVDCSVVGGSIEKGILADVTCESPIPNDSSVCPLFCI